MDGRVGGRDSLTRHCAAKATEPSAWRSDLAEQPFVRPKPSLDSVGSRESVRWQRLASGPMLGWHEKRLCQVKREAPKAISIQLPSECGR